MNWTRAAISSACAVALIAALAAPSLGAELRLGLEPYAGKLRQIKVDIAGEQRAFLFDTGGGHTLISPRVAAAIGCKPQGRALGFRMSGEKFETPICSDVTFRIGGFQADAETVGVYDLKALLPKELPPIDGLIALKSFEGRTIKLDLAANILIIGGARTGTASDALPCRLATGTDGGDLVVFVGARQRGMPLWFELDSGNLDDVRIAPHAAPAFGLDPAKRDEVQPLTLTLGSHAYALNGRVVDLIHDGALNARWLEQGVFSAELNAKPRCWWQNHDHAKP